MMSEELRSKDRKVIVVSSRLPYEIKSGSAAKHDQSDEQSDEQSGKTLEKSVSGLVRALEEALPEQSIWMGGVPKDEAFKDFLRLLKDENSKTTELKPVPISKELYEPHKTWCNGVLWPLLHGMLEKVNEEIARDQDCWKSYKKVNEEYAKAIASQLEKSQNKIVIIWIHDYHLFLVPTLVKQMLSEKLNLRYSIGFFLHIPFPPVETLEKLPGYKEIVNGMLGSDSIGFHIPAYKSNFLDSCKKHVKDCKINDPTESDHELHFPDGKQNRRKVLVQDVPAGIVYKTFSDLSGGEFSEEFPEDLKKLVEEFSGDKNKKLFIGVERLDYTKGLLEKVDAFQELLGKKLKHKVLYLQIAVPCRTTEKMYQDLRNEYDEKVKKIKSFFEDNQYQSKIDVRKGKFSPQDLSVLYKLSDVAWVTPIIDGLNLVALEYIACQTDDPGVLILSKDAGAAKYLDDALQVDPRNTEDMVETMYKAIEMEFEERQERMKKLQSQVKHRLDAERWVRSSLEPLKKRVKNMAKL